jgi:secondary thiamine-phosphate synthase enzyme
VFKYEKNCSSTDVERMFEIAVKSTDKTEFIDITDQVQEVVTTEKIKRGYVLVYVPHTTAAVTINEGADPAVQHDIVQRLETLVPSDGSYTHAEGNSDAHIKASLLGSHEVILVENTKLQLGRWQHVFFFEGDGPRNRTLYVQLVSLPA